jgi:hypothetical protein
VDRDDFDGVGAFDDGICVHSRVVRFVL